MFGVGEDRAEGESRQDADASPLDRGRRHEVAPEANGGGSRQDGVVGKRSHISGTRDERRFEREAKKTHSLVPSSKSMASRRTPLRNCAMSPLP
jgi:hypothetical protein